MTAIMFKTTTSVHLHCTESRDSNSVQGIKHNLEEENKEEQEIVEWTVTPKKYKKDKTHKY